MKLLGIETSSSVCSVALTGVNGETRTVEETEPNTHAKRLGPMVREITAEAGIELNGLDAIAVSNGPGSLTGLRIGLAFVKGISMASGIPLVAVPTLEAMARKVKEEGVFIRPLLYARKGYVFSALYRYICGSYEIIESPGVLNDDAVSGIVEEETYFIGDAPLLKSAEFREGASAEAKFLEMEDARPSAHQVVELGEEMFREGLISDTASVEPDYMMDFEAKRWTHPTA